MAMSSARSCCWSVCRLGSGKEIDPGVEISWVNKFREYVVTVCDTPKMNFPFGTDATLGDLPVFTEPTSPEGECMRFEAKIWEISYAKNTKERHRQE